MSRRFEQLTKTAEGWVLGAVLVVLAIAFIISRMTDG
jgi:hypothetical protein